MSGFEKWVRPFLAYMDAGSCSKHTIRAYRSDLDDLCKWISRYGRDLPDVQLMDLRAWLKYLSRCGLRPGTIRRKFAAAGSLFKHLVRRGDCPLNPVDFMRLPKGTHKLPSFLSEYEARMLVEAPELPEGLRDRAILETLWSTGCRVSELCSATVNELDLPECTIKVNGKGDKQRLVFLGPTSVSLLAEYLRGRAETLGTGLPLTAPLFANPSGRALTTRSIRRLLVKYSSKAGLRGRTTPHTLRHTFATHMLNRGADLRSVQEMLGHSHVSSTAIYIHISFERMRQVYEAAFPRA